MRNEMEISFDAVSVNEGFARVAVAAFVSPGMAIISRPTEHTQVIASSFSKVRAPRL